MGNNITTTQADIYADMAAQAEFDAAGTAAEDHLYDLNFEVAKAVHRNQHQAAAKLRTALQDALIEFEADFGTTATTMAGKLADVAAVLTADDFDESDEPHATQCAAAMLAQALTA